MELNQDYVVGEGALPIEIVEGHLAQPTKNALVHCQDETGPHHEVSRSVFYSKRPLASLKSLHSKLLLLFFDFQGNLSIAPSESQKTVVITF